MSLVLPTFSPYDFVFQKNRETDKSEALLHTESLPAPQTWKTLLDLN